MSTLHLRKNEASKPIILESRESFRLISIQDKLVASETQNRYHYYERESHFEIVLFK